MLRRENEYIQGKKKERTYFVCEVHWNECQVFVKVTNYCAAMYTTKQ